MELGDRLAQYVRAHVAGLWLQSEEPELAHEELTAYCRQQNWLLSSWDAQDGLSVDGHPPCGQRDDPLSALEAFDHLLPGDRPSIWVFRNLHRFLDRPAVREALSRQIIACSKQQAAIVVMAPVIEIPSELASRFVVLEQLLPDRQELEKNIRSVLTEFDEQPSASELEVALDAAHGLTCSQVRQAARLSLVRHGRVLPGPFWELKIQSTLRSPLLSLEPAGEGFSRLIGLGALRIFAKRSIESAGADGLGPRGILLLGLPGLGKSTFAKALGAESMRPTLTLDLKALAGFDSSQREARLREALGQAERMAPVVLLIEEIEQAISAFGSSDLCAGGFGTLLSWTSDHRSPVYIVVTCSDVRRLPVGFIQAERFDGVFFMDLPAAPARRAIWGRYLKQYGFATDEKLPADTGWTGAEIEACCRLAAMLKLTPSAARELIIPVAITARAALDRLRDWAEARALSAEWQGRYAAEPVTAQRRRMRRPPYAE